MPVYQITIDYEQQGLLSTTVKPDNIEHLTTLICESTDDSGTVDWDLLLEKVKVLDPASERLICIPIDISSEGS